MTPNHHDVTRKRYNAGKQHVLAETSPNDQDDSIRASTKSTSSTTLHTNTHALSAMTNALEVMQEEYFEVWQGIWPTGIDWTSAVLGTLVSGALNTLSMSSDHVDVPGSTTSMKEMAHENLINRYFSQVVASYFGQDAFRLRNEAYDDMLWVVLGWLESIKFVRQHSGLRFGEAQSAFKNDNSKQASWHGNQWIPSFAHRARLFWELASKGWDTSLCGGGMIWSPYLTPYKNAITNELFITASISMYLYFPGDDNTSPFKGADGPPVGQHDPRYLAAAVEGYKWLNRSNMTNAQGLYVDGFHISGWQRHPRNGTKRPTECDARNNMVYTYNQGVLLSGQRGLWEATGAKSYLEEGHDLVSNVINATGYDLEHDQPYQDDKRKHSRPNIGQWRGLGRLGILEDVCDAHGYCSQDSQTFKAIFFHHLTLFCAPLPPSYLIPNPDKNFDLRSLQDLQTWHKKSCARYAGWIRHNAEAAMSTRDHQGIFGGWWGAPRGNFSTMIEPMSAFAEDVVDYRNDGVPNDRTWQDRTLYGENFHHVPINMDRDPGKMLGGSGVEGRDPNDRGRGRTVETQVGGLAILRALWEIVDLPALQEDKANSWLWRAYRRFHAFASAVLGRWMEHI
jgi:hypothetical protein